ncbi:MAG: hypothetical protein OXC11_08625 [Rhodospirillales bacterium]|nr:hypothetical protein [Rhodospirillales bacterium]
MNEQIARLNAQPHGGLVAPLTAPMVELIVEGIADVAMQAGRFHLAVDAAREVMAEQELCHVPEQARQVKALLSGHEVADCVAGRKFADADEMTLFVAKQWLWTQVTARVRQKWLKRFGGTF